LVSFFDSLFKKKTPLSKMTRAELRRQELLLEKDRTQLLNRIEKIAKDKQTVFDRGSKESTPEIRRVLAQEFELKTTEQLMLGRQLNIRSKEMLTISRLRMLRESADRAGQSNRLGLISETDLLRLGRLIESDAIKTELYQERLDEILRVGTAADAEAGALTEAGQTVLKVWEKLDQGALTDAAEAFQEADRSVRERQAASE